MKVRLLSIFLLFSFFSSFVSASKDITIKVKDNGELVGLPEAFSPAKIDLSKRYIRIGRVKLNLPICVYKYFDGHEQFDLKVATNQSFTSIMFKVSPKKKDFDYRLLFTMEALIPIEFQVVTYLSPSSKATHKISMSGDCYAEIGKSYEVD